MMKMGRMVTNALKKPLFGPAQNAEYIARWKTVPQPHVISPTPRDVFGSRFPEDRTELGFAG